MSLNNVNFTKQNGGLGRPLNGNDHISGMAYYSATATASVFETIFEADTLSINSDAVLVEYVEDFFRYQPQGVLHLGVFTQSGTSEYDYEEVIEVQNFAEGKIRQMLVASDEVLGATAVGSLQAVATTLESASRPLSLVFEGDASDYDDITELPNLKSSGRKNISVVASKDSTKTGGAGGALLGRMAKSKVSESVAWVQVGNLTSGANYASIEMVTGESLQDLNDTALSSVKDKGYIVIRDFVDFDGRFFEDSITLDLETSDYATIELNRTIDKAIREARVSLIPSLSSPIVLNDDGSLTEGLISFFEATVSRNLDNMVNNGELSAYGITINPLQNVLSTSTITISISLLPLGVARNINVNIGFVVSVA